MRTPLTEAEHARLRDLMERGPLAPDPVDFRLAQLGLVCSSPGGRANARAMHVGPGGIEPYYEGDGSVNQVSYPTIGQPDVLDPANAPQRSKR
jgi:hypothetical protein